MTSGKLCTVPNCSRPFLAKGLCIMHYNRQKKGIPLNLPPFYIKGVRNWQLRDKARQHYLRRRNAEGATIRQHREVMEEVLHRKLTPTEVVHHKNGDTTDNRIENLEVMSWSEHSKLHHPRFKYVKEAQL